MPALLGAELLERHVERHAGVGRKRREHRGEQRAARRSGHKPTAPSASVSFGSRSRAAGFAPVCVPKPFARRAPAERTVERKAVRRERLEAAAATVAGEMLAVNLGPPVRLGHVVGRIGDVQHALAQRQRVLDAAGDARAGVGPNDDAVDHHFDQVLAAAIDRRRLVDRIASGRRRASARSPARGSRPTAFRTSRRPRISSGAIRYSFVPAGSAMILSMISSAVCVPIGMSQAGQCGLPSRAIRIRR